MKSKNKDNLSKVPSSKNVCIAMSLVSINMAIIGLVYCCEIEIMLHLVSKLLKHQLQFLNTILVLAAHSTTYTKY